VRTEPPTITMVPMAARCIISKGTEVFIQSSPTEGVTDSADITEHVALLLKLGSENPSDTCEPTVESGLYITASTGARFYKDGRRLRTDQALTMVADGLVLMLREALDQHRPQVRS
jgi:hypothetical protein